MTFRVAIFSATAATAAAFALVAALSWSTGPAKATPAYAQQTGKGCPVCHKMPPAATTLTPAGEKFKANGHKM
jgi:hypothetical protein